MTTLHKLLLTAVGWCLTATGGNANAQAHWIKEGIPGDIARNLNAGLKAQVEWYADKPSAGDLRQGATEGDSVNSVFMFDWESWFRIDAGARFDVGGWFEYGYPYAQRWASGIDLFQDSETLSRPVVLNEVYATIPLGHADIVLGRAIMRNTVSALYPLADRYCARDLNDPMDPKLLGTWQARLDYYRNDWQYTLAGLPVFQPPKFAGEESRWFLDTAESIIGQAIPTGLNVEHDRAVPGTSLDNLGVLGVVRTRQAGWDFFTSAYHGYSPYSPFSFRIPATPNTIELVSEYVPGFEWAAGLSTVVDTLELHTEALYHDTYNGKDDDYINWLVGCTWRPGLLSEWLRCNQLHITVEYANEHITSEQNHDGFILSSEPFRIGQDMLLTECLFEITGKDLASIAYMADFEDRNSFFRAKAGHRFDSGLRAEIVGEAFAGNGLYFGDWADNDRLYLNFEYRF